MSHKKNIPELELKNLIKLRWTNKEIANKYNCSELCVNRNMHRYGFLRKEIDFNINFFETIDTEAKAYWLGYISADGCIGMDNNCYRVEITSKDIEHLEKWHRDIDSNHEIHISYEKYGKSIHCSEKMYHDILKYGITERKSLTLEINFNLIPQSLIHHFIRGNFDGDGTICFENKKNIRKQVVVVFLGTQHLISNIQKILNIKNKIRKIENIYSLSVSGNKKTMTILNWMYNNATIYLDRKYQRYINHIEYINNQPSRISTAKYHNAFGESKTIYGWAKDDRFLIKNEVLIKNRLKLGWTIEEALTTPIRKRSSNDRLLINT